MQHSAYSDVTIMDNNYSKWVTKGQIYRSITYDISDYIKLLHLKVMLHDSCMNTRIEQTEINELLLSART